ncbi:MAG: hypothetical protein ACREXY_21325 [Gammaproteobacteria bacterium]
MMPLDLFLSEKGKPLPRMPLFFGVPLIMFTGSMNERNSFVFRDLSCDLVDRLL